MPELVNAVGGGDLGIELKLAEISKAIKGEIVRYDPEHWPGLYIRFTQDSPAVLVFRTGNYNIAGADSIQELLDAKDEFTYRLTQIGIDEVKSDFEIRNLVYLDDYGRELELEHIAIALGLERTEYEPEQFPGLMYDSPNSSGKFLIFQSGKVILTGEKEASKASNSFKTLFELFNSLFAE